MGYDWLPKKGENLCVEVWSEEKASVYNFLSGETIMSEAKTLENGEWSKIFPATQVVEDLCNKVRPEINEKLGKNYTDVSALKYRDWKSFTTPEYPLQDSYKILAKGGNDYLSLWMSKTPELFDAKLLPAE